MFDDNETAVMDHFNNTNVLKYLSNILEHETSWVIYYIRDVLK
jgi:hypothetical protein